MIIKDRVETFVGDEIFHRKHGLEPVRGRVQREHRVSRRIQRLQTAFIGLAHEDHHRERGQPDKSKNL